MTTLFVVGAILLYFMIACYAAYLMGRYDPESPAWGALIWPITLPLIVLFNIFEFFHDVGKNPP